jgi:GNAT superfamily N-acetyltransferase
MNKSSLNQSEGFTLRSAKETDVGLILQFINELGAYEKLSHEVVATEEKLHNTLFVQKMAEVLIGEFKSEAVGFALFFHNYSTFLGQAGLYLEDLYIKPEVRGKGFGKTMLTYLAKLAVERGCGRLEWACLDWNYPSISFYKNLGAKALDEWTVYRVSGETLQKLADIEMG